MQKDPPVCSDKEALERAADRVLFCLSGCKWLGSGAPDKQEPASMHRDSSHAKSENRVRQVVWLRGRAVIRTGGGSGGQVRLEPGTVWRAGEEDRVVWKTGMERGQPGESLGVELVFSGALARDYVGFLEENFGRLVRLPTGARALRGARLLAAKPEAAREVLARRVFAWLASLHEALETRQVHVKDLLRGRIDHLLPEGAAHGYSIKALAAHLGCSSGWLARRLQHAWRRPAGEVLQALRLRHAKQLLLSTKSSVGEVAWKCGFASPSSFSKAYRHAMGMTPTEARARREEPSLPSDRSEQALVVRTDEKEGRIGVALRDVLPAGWEVTPVAVWGGAYFQCDGGETDLIYDTPFDISINTITRGLHWVVTLEGEAVFESGGCSLTTRPGMVVVYPSPSKGRWTTPSGKPWRRVWVKVRCEWGNEALLALGEAHGWAAMLPLSSRPVRLAKKWVGEWNKHRNEPSVAASRSGYEWLLSWWDLLQSGRVHPVARRDAGGRMTPVLPNLRQALLPSFFRRIKTISGYAKQIGFSRAHTVRKLNEQWKGGTPAQIIRRQRLAQAALDLRRTRLPVSEIARRSQFASAGCFIPAFKREFGMTPLAYRLAQL